MAGGKKPSRGLRRRSSAGWLRLPRPTRLRIVSSEPRSVATRCPSGWPTRRSGLRRSVPPRPRWKPDDDGSGDSGKGRPGRKSKPVTAEPSDKAQRNFTDPDSRVMPTKNGFIQGYNAQAAVDGAHQIIVAHTLTNSPSDQAQLAPLLDAIKANLGKNPDEASADAGYCSQANLRMLIRRRIEG